MKTISQNLPKSITYIQLPEVFLCWGCWFNESLPSVALANCSPGQHIISTSK